LQLVLIHVARSSTRLPGVVADAERLSTPNADPSELAEALRQNEERLRHAMQAAAVGIFDHTVIPLPPPPPFWSETLRAILGYDARAEPDFVWFRGRVHPEDGHQLDEAIAHAMGPHGDGRIEIEYRWLHPEKGYRWLMNRSVTHYTEHDGQRVPHRSV